MILYTLVSGSLPFDGQNLKVIDICPLHRVMSGLIDSCCVVTRDVTDSKSASESGTFLET